MNLYFFNNYIRCMKYFVRKFTDQSFKKMRELILLSREQYSKRNINKEEEIEVDEQSNDDIQEINDNHNDDEDDNDEEEDKVSQSFSIDN